jgi:hypothetical protein
LYCESKSPDIKRGEPFPSVSAAACFILSLTLDLFGATKTNVSANTVFRGEDLTETSNARVLSLLSHSLFSTLALLFPAYLKYQPKVRIRNRTEVSPILKIRTGFGIGTTIPDTGTSSSTHLLQFNPQDKPF